MIPNDIIEPIRAICEDYRNSAAKRLAEKTAKAVKDRILSRNSFTAEEWKRVEQLQRESQPEPRTFQGGDGQDD